MITLRREFPLLILSVLAVLIFSSCNKRLCKNIDCGHGICEYGICECEDGWKIDSDGKCLKQELCFGVDCGHGVCFSSDGTCQCDPNYELDSLGRCNRLWREKFLGTWLGSHINDNNDTIGPYSMTVTPVTSDIQKVQINNFCDYTCAFTGTGLVVNALVSFQTNLGFFSSYCTGITASGQWNYIDESHCSISIWISQSGQLTQCDGIFQRQ